MKKHTHYKIQSQKNVDNYHNFFRPENDLNDHRLSHYVVGGGCQKALRELLLTAVCVYATQ